MLKGRIKVLLLAAVGSVAERWVEQAKTLELVPLSGDVVL